MVFDGENRLVCINTYMAVKMTDRYGLVMNGPGRGDAVNVQTARASIAH